MPGPVPKRSTQRRRRNKPAGGEIDRAEAAGSFTPPKANSKWHPTAKIWFDSLAASGQARYYEPSDWALAIFLAEAMSRELKPQYVGTSETGDVIREVLPVKGASISALLKGMTSLLISEGDRRRMRLELERNGPAPADRDDPKVARMSEHRSRFAG
jgi:hypothetical protein